MDICSILLQPGRNRSECKWTWVRVLSHGQCEHFGVQRKAAGGVQLYTLIIIIILIIAHINSNKVFVVLVSSIL